MIRALSRTNGGKLPFKTSFPIEQQKRCQVNLFSTVTATTPESSGGCFFKTSETNPNNLSERHLGRFYSISDDIFKKLYDHTRHFGFPLEFHEQSKTLREQCILVRNPFLELKKCVDAVNLQKPVVRFLLYGVAGSGKSMISASMVQYAYVNEYVIIHLPWLPHWTQHSREIVVSTSKPGYFNHTVDAVTWLTKFKAHNLELVQKLNLVTEKEYQWTKREITPSGSSIMDIVEHGITRPAHASDCMSVLFQEIKNQSSQQKCKTMVIADAVNTLFYECRQLTYRNPIKRWADVPISNVTALEAMKNLFKADWSGGVIIVVTDIMGNPGTFRESHFPRYLLRQEGWELFDPFVPIEVPIYTSQEVQTMIDYYLETKWLAHPKAGTEEGRLELECLSTKNPFTLTKLCNSR